VDTGIIIIIIIIIIITRWIIVRRLPTSHHDHRSGYEEFKVEMRSAEQGVED